MLVSVQCTASVAGINPGVLLPTGCPGDFRLSMMGNAPLRVKAVVAVLESLRLGAGRQCSSCRRWFGTKRNFRRSFPYDFITRLFPARCAKKLLSLCTGKKVRVPETVWGRNPDMQERRRRWPLSVFAWDCSLREADAAVARCFIFPGPFFRRFAAWRCCLPPCGGKIGTAASTAGRAELQPSPLRGDLVW